MLWPKKKSYKEFDNDDNVVNEATTSGSEKKNPHCGAYRKGAEPVRSCRPSLSGVFDKGERLTCCLTLNPMAR